MNYEQKYKEALERVKSLYGNSISDNAILEHIFPELRESEDERIRRTLLDEMMFLKEKGQIKLFGLNIKDIIAYLEKQKEQEQPVEGLEGEIREYEKKFGDINEMGGYEIIMFDDEFRDTLRHFYELGCTRTAVMYDDIEYERQRAEEAELSGDLEEELENYAKLYPFEDAGSYRNLITLARHFAEWGAENLKR